MRRKRGQKHFHFTSTFPLEIFQGKNTIQQGVGHTRSIEHGSELTDWQTETIATTAGRKEGVVGGEYEGGRGMFRFRSWDMAALWKLLLLLCTIQLLFLWISFLLSFPTDFRAASEVRLTLDPTHFDPEGYY